MIFFRQKEWNVQTVSSLAVASPISFLRRSDISSAAFRVKVIATIFFGLMPDCIIFSILCVRTVVLPDPAPATTRQGPFMCSTALIWSGFILLPKRGRLLCGFCGYAPLKDYITKRLFCGKRKEQEEIIEGQAEADKLEMNASVKGNDIDHVTEAQKQIVRIMKDNKMLNEDIKGIDIDLNF